MFRIVSVIIFIIALGSFISAQETVSPCPTIQVVEESKVIQPGEFMFFRAVINGNLQKHPIEYKWTIDQGVIFEGQGTDIIRVDTKGLEDTTVKATFEIFGLPQTCKSSATGTNVVAQNFGGCGLPPIGDVINDVVRNETDNLFIRLQNDPSTTGYLVSYGTEKDIKNREKLFESHIKLRRYDRKKIVFLRSVEEIEIRTEVYLVPEGATPPTP